MKKVAVAGMILMAGLVVWSVTADAATANTPTGISHRLSAPSIEGHSDDFNDAAIASEKKAEAAVEDVENASIPEPTTLALMGFGMAGIALRKRFTA